jgi:hypothetical protein
MQIPDSEAAPSCHGGIAARGNKAAAGTAQKGSKFPLGHTMEYIFPVDGQWVRTYEQFSADLSEQLAGA